LSKYPIPFIFLITILSIPYYMAKNKLHMTSKKTKKRKRKTKRLTKKERESIVDVPLSKKLSKGSKASLGSINYNYLSYKNTFSFLEKIIQNKKLKRIVCIPKLGEGWMKAFLSITLSHEKGKEDYSIKPLDMGHTTKFIEEINNCNRKRFIPINLGIYVPGSGSHANIVLIDNKKKTIEQFEPHGKRGEGSELESVSKAYIKITKNLERFFKKNLPQYKFISPKDYEPKFGLQVRLDAFSGLCVTWCILYIHYRILNPNIPLKKLIQYMDKRVTKPFLLRYTRYVEDILKNKSKI